MIELNISIPVQLIYHISSQFEVAEVRPRSPSCWLISTTTPASKTIVPTAVIIAVIVAFCSGGIMLPVCFSNLSEHENAVKTDNFPLFLNLVLGQVVHALLDNAVVELLQMSCLRVFLV